MNYTITNDAITAMIDGQPFTIISDNPAYNQVRQAILNKESEARIIEMFRTAESVKRYAKGNIKIKNGELLYKGEVLHNVIVDRILNFMAAGLPVQPLLKFLDRMMANPVPASREALYKFLETRFMPITEDGYFLGYKGVLDNYMDAHTGTISNKPGTTVPRMERRAVDDRRYVDCSHGYHVGSEEYATGFSQRTVIVQVDPADVVSVPGNDCTWKVRVMQYTVICDYKGKMNEFYADKGKMNEFYADKEQPYEGEGLS